MRPVPSGANFFMAFLTISIWMLVLLISPLVLFVSPPVWIPGGNLGINAYDPVGAGRVQRNITEFHFFFIAYLIRREEP